jgi:hypothetical protein
MQREMKSSDEYLQFVFLTGVSKISALNSPQEKLESNFGKTIRLPDGGVCAKPDFSLNLQ